MIKFLIVFFFILTSNCISEIKKVNIVGNARVNARGDELGPGGKIIRKREDVVSEYFTGKPNKGE